MGAGHTPVDNAADLQVVALAAHASVLIPISKPLRTQYLGSVSVPAQVLREAVEADVVGLTLRPRRAEGQAVIVLLHLLHLQPDTQHVRVTSESSPEFTWVTSCLLGSRRRKKEAERKS